MENKEIEKKQMTPKETLLKMGEWLLTIIFVGFLISYPVMWLWNGVLSPIGDIPNITVLQAWGISILSRLIFTSQGPS